jgi:hypothetical protein
MSIEEKIKRHIEDEKQLSLYKVSILKSGDLKGYKKRLIMKEEDFVNYDFSKINFQSLDELRSALLLFKTSREAFDEKYGDSKKLSLEIVSETDLKKIKEKISFIELKCKWILDKKIKEINIVENKTLQSFLREVPANLDKMDINKIKKLEGSAIGKKRARIQLLIFCFAKFMFLRTKKLQAMIKDPDINYSQLKAIENEIFKIFIDYKLYYYQYFNGAILELPMLLEGTLGENDYIEFIHPLKNIVPEISDFYIHKISDKNTKVFNESGKFIDKKSSDRSYGFNTSIKRIGNETARPYYLEIISEEGAELSDVFDRSFFNNYVNNEYIKAVSLLPLKNINFLIKKNKEFSSFFLEEEYNADIINSGATDKIFLSKKNSIILTAETRSDSEHLDDSEKVIDLLINSIKNEYKEDFKISNNLEEDDYEFERNKILRKFLEPK